ncbi:MAG: fucose isomerase [Bacteroides sp.]
MKINLITFSSRLSKQNEVYKIHETMLSEIEKYYTIKLVDYKDIDTIRDNDFQLVFIATGGVERLVSQHYEKLPHPLLLLTDGLQNSLASALEIASWVHAKGLKAQIIHGDSQTIIKQINTDYENFKAQQFLYGKRIGVIGFPSSWLIASGVNYLLAKRRWGVEFTDSPLDDLVKKFNQISEEEVGEQSSSFASKALACREGSPQDLLTAMRLYKAVQLTCEEKRFDAFTLSCFELINKINTTGCLTLSLMNNQGILAGCEGDLQSIFTILMVKAITGQTSFMANPSSIIEKNNEIILSHCTIATDLTETYIIRNHFESGCGIAIQGVLAPGDVTIVRCGGECLDEYFVSSGVLVENTNYMNACRTQVRVKLNNPASYFLRNPLGNHHILIKGNYEQKINDFMQMNGCKRVE